MSDKFTPLFDYDKTIQALNFMLDKEPNKTMSKLKLVKLLFLADRYTLRNYGYCLSGDTYFAMEHGPVGSSIKRILDGEVKTDEIKVLSDREIKSEAPVDDEEFSKTDLEALNKVWETYGDMGAIELRDLTHEFPEWKRFEADLKKNPRQRFEVEIDDFFANPKDKIDRYIFSEDKDTLAVNKDNYEEERQLNNVFA